MATNFLSFYHEGKRYGVRFFSTTHVIRSIVKYVDVNPKRWDREPYVRTFVLKEDKYPEIWEAAEEAIESRAENMRRIAAEVKHDARMIALEESRKRDAIVLAEEIGSIIDRYHDDCNRTSELGGSESMNRSALNRVIFAYHRFCNGAVAKVS